MKTIIFLLLISTGCFAQDSVKITIAPQCRDLEYIYATAYNDNALENFNDSLKAKFRVPTPPTGNTTVSFIAYTMDWVLIIQALKKDEVAIQAGCTSRIETLLRAVNQSFLTGKIDAVDVAETNFFQDKRSFGRQRLKRN